MSKRSYIINGTQLNELSIRWRTIYEATDHCADTDCLLCRFGVLTRGALHAQFTYTNGLYGRKTFMLPLRVLQQAFYYLVKGATVTS